MKRLFAKVKENKKIAAESFAHGTTIAAGTGFIIWMFELGSIIIPGAAAAFLAGLLVPVVNYYLRKLER